MKLANACWLGLYVDSFICTLSNNFGFDALKMISGHILVDWILYQIVYILHCISMYTHSGLKREMLKAWQTINPEKCLKWVGFVCVKCECKLE